MIYLLPRGQSMRHYPRFIGFFDSLANRQSTRPILEGRPWALDNGAFVGAFDAARFRRVLLERRDYARSCLFVVAPDVIGDAAATLEQFEPWRDEIHALGYRVAFVAHDGQRPEALPACDAVFIGGTDSWRFTPAMHAVVLEARRRGLWLHVGRVNSMKRIKGCMVLGADSVDGSKVRYAGPRNYVRMLERVYAQTPVIRA